MGLTLNSVKIQLHRDIKLHKAAGDQEKFSEAIIVRNLRQVFYPDHHFDFN